MGSLRRLKFCSGDNNDIQDDITQVTGGARAHAAKALLCAAERIRESK